MLSLRTPIVAAAVAGQALASGKTALLIVDVQDCFLEALTTSGEPGSLEVPASHIIAKINQVREEKECLFDKVVFTQDHHPENHISFGSAHGLDAFSHLTAGKGSLPLMCITPSSGFTSDGACCPTFHVNRSAVDCTTQLCPPGGWDYSVNNSGMIQGNDACTQCADDPGRCFATSQEMWTDHCLQSGDSTFPPSLNKRTGDMVVQKGMNQFADAYSAFMDNTGTLKTQLDATLQAEDIQTVYVAGIATDVCVKWTVRDALAGSRYSVKVISDATAAVLGDQANFDDALAFMEDEGAEIISMADVLAMACNSESSAAMDTGALMLLLLPVLALLLLA